MNTIEKAVYIKSIIEAFLDKRQIQVKTSYRSGWTDTNDPYWDFSMHEYRIKPEKQKIPLTVENLIKISRGQNIWVRNISSNINIINLDKVFIVIGFNIKNNTIRLKRVNYNLNSLQNAQYSLDLESWNPFHREE